MLHRSLGEKNRTILTGIHVTTISLSSFITILLIVTAVYEIPGQGNSVTIISGIISAIVAGLTSWTKYAGYESLAMMHTYEPLLHRSQHIVPAHPLCCTL